MSLLENAKKKPRHASTKRSISNEEIELLKAWLKDEIGLKQMAEVLKSSSSNCYYIIAMVVREAYRRGEILIK